MLQTVARTTVPRSFINDQSSGFRAGDNGSVDLRSPLPLRWLLTPPRSSPLGRPMDLRSKARAGPPQARVHCPPPRSPEAAPPSLKRRGSMGRPPAATRRFSEGGAASGDRGGGGAGRGRLRPPQAASGRQAKGIQSSLHSRPTICF